MIKEPMKCIRREQIVEAEQFVLGAEMPMLEFLGLTDSGFNRENEYAKFDYYDQYNSTLFLKMENGDTVEVENGDFVVKHTDGKYYVYTEENFHLYYLEYISPTEVIEHVKQEMDYLKTNYENL